ncbi:MAG: AEC family transporter [Johnsonella sp.]|nr:AEC family transporter [Johnsonella sp.]
MDFLSTLQNVSILFSLILIGYIIGKLKFISPAGQKEITKLVLYVTMPATIIMAMQVPFSRDKADNILSLIIIMICCYIGLLSISFLVSFFFKVKSNQKDIYRVAMVLSNTSFMGYPVVLALLGQDALFYAVICAGFIFELVSWTFGTYTIGRHCNNSSFKTSLKKAILNPGVLSILIGGGLFLANLSIPEPISSTMNMLSRATSPIAMIVVGLILSNSKIGDAFTNRNIYVVCAFKLLINPLLISLCLKLFGFSGIRLILPVVVLSMPTAAYVAMFSDNLGNDKDLAGQIVFICSLLSLITIPLIATFLI